MKATGIVRRIDDLGRVVIPKEIRRTFHIANGDPIEFYVEADTVILKKFVEEDCCVVCRGHHTNLIKLDAANICNACAHTVARAVN